MNTVGPSRDGDLLGLLLRRQPREGDRQDSILHCRLDLLGLYEELLESGCLAPSYA